MRARDKGEVGSSGRDDARSRPDNHPNKEAAAGRGGEGGYEKTTTLLQRAFEGLGKGLLGEKKEQEEEEEEGLDHIIDNSSLREFSEWTQRVLHLSGQEYDSDEEVDRSARLDELAAGGHISHTTPVEKQIFKNHTKWFGLFFKTLEMERIFLDSHARLKKNVVYLGYVLVVFVFVVELIFEIFRFDIVRLGCDCNDGINIVDTTSVIIGADSTTIDAWLLKNDDASPEWREVCVLYGTYYFSTILPLTFLGCCLHWFVHRSSRVKEKSWAFLIVFVMFLLILAALYLGAIAAIGIEWVNSVWFFTIPIVSIIFFFSGMPTFIMFFLLLIYDLTIILVAYYAWTVPRALKNGKDSDEYLMLTYSFISQLNALQIYLLYLVGSYLVEIANRREFLQRTIMHNQQKQIIREKSKNENLQRQLLENMLPSSIVDQLQKTNFTVSSWDQLRALSRRHFGVSIMFAKVENFTAFSSQVDPEQVMEYLNDLYLVFDNLCEQHEVYKVETVGDQYVAAVGVVTGEVLTENTLSMRGSQLMLSTRILSDAFDSKDEHSSNFTDRSIRNAACSNTAHMISYAKAIMEGSTHIVLPPEVKARPVLRIGIHTGPCISGIVGTKNLRFCLFGDTMNTTARMEQTSMAECIHVTEDVVSLAPDHSWEKLEKLNVKGKGSMQTYHLDLSSDREYGVVSGNGQPSLYSLACAYPVGNDVADRSDNSDSSEDMLTSANFVRCMTRAKGGVKSLHDSRPVKDDVFRHHTKWFGLAFKKLSVERAFLDFHSRLHKNSVYLAFFLYVVELSLNILSGYMFFLFFVSNCSKPVNEDFCFAKFGAGAYISQEYQEGDPITYKMLLDNALIRIPPGIAGVLAVLITYGILSHWFIHRSERFKEKWWAFLNVWVVLALNIIVLDLAIVYLRLPDDQSPWWPYAFFFPGLIVPLLLIVCTGAPFLSILLIMVLSMCLRYGISIPVLMQDTQSLKSDGDITHIIAITGFYDTSFTLFYCHIIMLIGSYLTDITNRKRFLQRILLLDTQGQIIRAKAKTEKTQKAFLENILPPSLVGELQQDERQMRQDDIAASAYRRLKSLSKSHVGVSMLYADLVGFTEFSSQLDPFIVMSFLNTLFHVFDDMCDQYNVYKLETIGDCYVATVGLVTGNTVSAQLYANDLILRDSMIRKKSVANAKDLVAFAKAMMVGSKQITKPGVNTPAIMRIGMHTGSCISGIIGTKMLKFCLFGDVVETAAEMEKSGTPGYIHASQELADLAPEEPWKKHVTNKKGSDSGEKRLCTYLLSV